MKKTVWRERRGDVWSFYCPLCNVSRRVPYRPHPGGTRHIGQVGLSTAVFMLMSWNWLSWKGVVAFLPFWAVFEVVYRLRMRAALTCPNCGFDPYLYLTDVPKARRAVEEHWRKIYAEKGIPYPTDPNPSLTPFHPES